MVSGLVSEVTLVPYMRIKEDNTMDNKHKKRKPQIKHIRSTERKDEVDTEHLTTYLSNVRKTKYKFLLEALSLPQGTSFSDTSAKLTLMTYTELIERLKAAYILSDDRFWRALMFEAVPELSRILARTRIPELLKTMYRDYRPTSYYISDSGATIHRYLFWEQLYAECSVALCDSVVCELLTRIVEYLPSKLLKVNNNAFQRLLEQPFLSVFLAMQYTVVRNAIIISDSPLYNYLPFPKGKWIDYEISIARATALKRLLSDPHLPPISVKSVHDIFCRGCLEEDHNTILFFLSNPDILTLFREEYECNGAAEYDFLEILGRVSPSVLKMLYGGASFIFTPSMHKQTAIQSAKYDCVGVLRLCLDSEPSIKVQCADLVDTCFSNQSKECISLLETIHDSLEYECFGLDPAIYADSLPFFQRHVNDVEARYICAKTLKSLPFDSSIVENLTLSFMMKTNGLNGDILEIYDWVKEMHFHSVLQFLEATKPNESFSNNISPLYISLQRGERTVIDSYTQSLTAEEILQAVRELLGTASMEIDRYIPVLGAYLLAEYKKKASSIQSSYASICSIFRYYLEGSHHRHSIEMTETFYTLFGYSLFTDNSAHPHMEDCLGQSSNYSGVKHPFIVELFNDVRFEYPEFTRMMVRYSYIGIMFREEVNTLLDNLKREYCISEYARTNKNLHENIKNKNPRGIVNILQYGSPLTWTIVAKNIDLENALMWREDVAKLTMMMLDERGKVTRSMWERVIDGNMRDIAPTMLMYDNREGCRDLITVLIEKKCYWLLDLVIDGFIDNYEAPPIRFLLQLSENHMKCLIEYTERFYANKIRWDNIQPNTEQSDDKTSADADGEPSLIMGRYLKSKYYIHPEEVWGECTEEGKHIILLFSRCKLSNGGLDLLKTEEIEKTGHTVRMLLARGDFDPLVGDNLAIFVAVKQKDLSAIRILLKDSRVDPSANNSAAFQIACRFGPLEIVQELIGHAYDRKGAKGVDPAANRNQGLINACYSGKHDIVKCLLGLKGVCRDFACAGYCGRICPRGRDSMGSRLAVHNGHDNVVRILDIHDARLRKGT